MSSGSHGAAPVAVTMATACAEVGELIGCCRFQRLVGGDAEQLLSRAINNQEDEYAFIHLAYFRAPAIAVPPSPGTEIVHLSRRRRRKVLPEGLSELYALVEPNVRRICWRWLHAWLPVAPVLSWYTESAHSFPDLLFNTRWPTGLTIRNEGLAAGQ